jgi:hypothetical protein
VPVRVCMYVRGRAERTQRLSVDDFGHIGEMPCVRRAFMLGIASGVGIGAVRSVSVGASVRSSAHRPSLICPARHRPAWSMELGIPDIHGRGRQLDVRTLCRVVFA